MAISLPPRTDDPALAAWYLEVQKEIERLERLIEDLQRANTNNR